MFDLLSPDSPSRRRSPTLIGAVGRGDAHHRETSLRPGAKLGSQRRSARAVAGLALPLVVVALGAVGFVTRLDAAMTEAARGADGRGLLLIAVLLLIAAALAGLCGSLVAFGPEALAHHRRLRDRAVQAERDLWHFFELSDDACCVASSEGVIRRANGALRAHLSPDGTTSLLDLTHPADRPTVAAALRSLAEGAACSFEARLAEPGGSWARVAWTAHPSPDLGAFHATGRDVTAEREARAELLRSNADLDQFAHVASHDLRSPLRDIDNLASWLESDVADLLPEASRGHLATMRQRILRMEQLLSDLLAYCRVGRNEEQHRWIQPSELVDAALGVVTIPKGMAVETDLTAAPFWAAQAPLQLALRNLVDNAVKHHDRSDGRIVLRIRDDEDAVVLEVEDDGPGIPPEQQERVFRLFETLRRRDEQEGSGVGLALVKKVVDGVDGSIVVHSRGRGTRFTLRWPRPALPRDLP